MAPSEAPAQGEQFKAFLRARLTSRGLTVAALARQAQVSERVMRRWLQEDGPKRPSDTNLKKLAPALGISEEQLLRLAGYLATEDEDAIDPDAAAVLATIRADWPNWEDWRRKAIKALTSTAVGVGLLRTNTAQPAHAHVGLLA